MNKPQNLTFTTVSPSTGTTTINLSKSSNNLPIINDLEESTPNKFFSLTKLNLLKNNLITFTKDLHSLYTTLIKPIINKQPQDSLWPEHTDNIFMHAAALFQDFHELTTVTNHMYEYCKNKELDPSITPTIPIIINEENLQIPSEIQEKETDIIHDWGSFLHKLTEEDEDDAMDDLEFDLSDKEKRIIAGISDSRKRNRDDFEVNSPPSEETYSDYEEF